MRAEDINFEDENKDEIMILIEQNINLEQAVDMTNELIRTLDEVQNLEEITNLLLKLNCCSILCVLDEMKEFVLKLYIKSLERNII